MVSPNALLTSAHCVTHFPGGSCNIDKGFAVIGALNTNDPKAVAEFIGLSECTVHPKYKRSPEGLLEYDAAILNLDRRSTHMPVWLDDGTNEVETGTGLTVLGWTRRSQHYSGLSLSLVQRETKYATHKRCNEVTSGLIRYSHVCSLGGTTLRNSRFEPDNGDSGSPLVFKGRGSGRHQDIQVGIVSMALDTMKPEFPVIYTSVANVAAWVKGNVEEVRLAQVRADDKALIYGLIGVACFLVLLAAAVAIWGRRRGQG